MIMFKLTNYHIIGDTARDDWATSNLDTQIN